MTLENQISTCSQHYQRWKSHALLARDVYEARKALERAFFWLELQTAFITLFAVEQTKGKDKTVKNKLLIAKANLSKKLAEYAKEILNEM